VEWQSLDPAVECRVLVAVEADGNREQLKLEDCKMLQGNSCAGKAPSAPSTSPVLAEGFNAAIAGLPVAPVYR
jgi:hypothetical protein